MARKSTIGINPLDALVPIKKTEEETPTVKLDKSRKERATFQLPLDLIERARDVVYWTPGATMAWIMEDALTSYLDNLEKKRGNPFPKREGMIRTGRPVK